MVSVIYISNSYIYNIVMELKHYLKIDNVWYRAICKDCYTPIQGNKQTQCRNCFIESIKGKVRVVHNKPHSQETKEQMSIKRTYSWADSGYGAKHRKIRDKYGKASRCENKACKGKSKKYEWANLDHKYSEDISTWKQLCAGCHRVQDGQRIIKC